MTIKIVTIKPDYIAALGELQRLCFPYVEEDEYFSAAELASHCRIFPEGSLVALDDDKPVGFGTGLFVDFDFDHPNHSSTDITGGGDYSNHNPAGAYYYGADIGVHPAYRRRGIGGMLYAARKELVQRYNKQGIVAGGMIPDYAHHKDVMTAEAYVAKVVAGELHDATLTYQLKQGFVVRGVIPDFVQDDSIGRWGSLIYWENPTYQPIKEGRC